VQVSVAKASGLVEGLTNHTILVARDGTTRPIERNAAPMRDARGTTLGAVLTFRDVSERRQQEKALRDSEERFRQLADAMPQIVWTARADGSIDYYNERWYEYTGFAREYNKPSWGLILHPDDLERCFEAYFGCVRDGTPFQIEYRFKDGTGGYRWHLGRALPVRDATGQVVRWFGTCTDIDDQKQVEGRLEQQVSQRTAELTEANRRLRQEVDERRAAVEALQRSEAMFEGLFQFAPDAILVTGTDGRIRQANLQAERTFGYGRDELIGQPVEVLIPERFHASHRESRAGYAVRPRPRPMGEGRELFARRKDGGEFPVDVMLAPLETPDGLLALSTVRDISHRKANENIIKARARQGSALAEFGQRALGPTDIDSLLSEAVAVVARTLDADLALFAERAPGGDDLVLRAGCGWPPTRAMFSGGTGSHAGYCMMVGHPVVVADLLNTGKEGARFTPSPSLLELGAVSGICVRVTGKAGPHGVLGAHTKRPRQFTTEDVDFMQTFGNVLAAVIDRARAERQVQASLAEKEVLLKEVHHRVKNNLQIISSLLDLQSGHTAGPPAEMFRESQTRVRSMALVHERLYRSADLAKVDFTAYVGSLADHLFQTYRVGHKEIGLDLRVGADVRLSIDAAIPCGLLLNELVSNSLKHAFRGKEPGTIRIELRHTEGNRWLLVVADDGIGLPAGTSPQTAQGLGLQLVAMLTRQLKGTVEIERSGGTTFRVTFPAGNEKG
jgi:PAS domain S-box-containing protein